MRVLVLLRSPYGSSEDHSPLDGLGPRDRAALLLAQRVVATAPGGGTVVALTAGPPEHEAALRRALKMGTTRGIRIWRRDLEHATGCTEVSALLARGAAEIGFDLILAGDRSTDRGSGMLGPAVAHRLGLPHLAGVVGAEWHALGKLLALCLYGPRLLRVSFALPGVIGAAGTSPGLETISNSDAPTAPEIELMTFDPPGSPSDPHAATLQTLGEIDMPLLTRGKATRRVDLDDPPPGAERLADAEALLGLVKKR